MITPLKAHMITPLKAHMITPLKAHMITPLKAHMKNFIASGISGLFLIFPAFAGENLYTIGPAYDPDPTPSSAGSTDDSAFGIVADLPINWTIGTDFTYDDNVLPGSATKESSFGISPYISAGLLSITPQTKIDMLVRLGMVYYLDAPDSMDDLNSSSRASLNITHNVNERVRVESRNFISYELEPNYAYGYASSRQGREHLYAQSDNSVGYRWSERLGTKTGLLLSQMQYQDVANQDRATWELYNQFRYVLSPKSIATFDYRYGVTTADGNASDSTNQFLLLGVEHRFSPNSIATAKVGAQLRDVDQGDDGTSPYFEGSVLTQVNEQIRIRANIRYGIESYDTVQSFSSAPGGLVEYDEKNTLRFGLSGDYAINPLLSFFGGVDYITTQFESGRVVSNGAAFATSDENFFTGYVGVSYKIKKGLTGTATYTYSDSDSDIAGRSYERNRISLGLNAAF